MQSTNGRMRILSAALVAAAAALVGACELTKQRAPGLTGPSGFGLTLRLSATPDTLPRDGASRSVVSVEYADADRRPLTDRRLTVSASAGTLAVQEVVTNSSGRASFEVTAPPPNWLGSNFSITVTPVGDDHANSVAGSVLIGLSGPDVPVADFTIAPSTPAIGQPVTFDASNTKLGDRNCGVLCTYRWDFGDGDFGEGMLVQHIFHTAGVHMVTLTVTNTRGGTTNSVSKPVGFAAEASTVTVTFTPAAPNVGAQVAFIAVPKLAAGVFVRRYVWNFGDGNADVTTQAPGVTHTYNSAGNYIVTLTLVDSLGREAVTTVAVPVTVPEPEP